MVAQVVISNEGNIGRFKKPQAVKRALDVRARATSLAAPVNFLPNYLQRKIGNIEQMLSRVNETYKESGGDGDFPITILVSTAKDR